jgi:FkbM family methyltransferase
MEAWRVDTCDNQVLQHAMRLFDRLADADVAPGGSGSDDFVARFGQANTALEAGDFVTARVHLEACGQLVPDWPFTQQRLGCIDAFAGRFDEASAHFARWGSANLPPDAYIDLRPGFLQTLDPGMEAALRPAPEAGPQAVVMVACDPVYFRRFAHTLVRSLRENAGVPLLVHLHVFDPDPWIAEELATLPVGGDLLRLDVSFEEYRGEPGDGAKTHYSCARLYQVAGLLARHRLPVIMLDADVLVLRDFAPLLDLACGHDVALLLWPRTNWRIWDHVYGSTVVFSPTAGGMRFARMVGNYVRVHVGRPGGAWYLDQIALFAAQAYLRDRGVAVAEIPAHWYSLFGRDGNSPAPDALFWSVTANIQANQQALSGALVRRFAPETRRAYGWTLPGTDTFSPTILAQAPTEDGRRRWDHALMQACAERTRTKRRRAIDAGAHVGFWSEWLARRFACVDAFEPHPLLQTCFRVNVPCENVNLHCCGLGDADTKASMVLGAGNTGVSHIVLDGGGDIPISRLDAFGFDDIDFIKIDVEGFEARVLRGAEQTLRRCKPLVLVEEIALNSARYGDRSDAVASLLGGFGATLVAELSDRHFLYAWP